MLSWIIDFLSEHDVTLTDVKSDASQLLQEELDSAEQATNDEDTLKRLDMLRGLFSLPRLIEEDGSDGQSDSVQETSDPAAENQS